MNRVTRLKQFSPQVLKIIDSRDRGCLFCAKRYRMTATNSFEYQMFDPMHIVGKGRGGLGIEENGIKGCRHHHKMYDSNNPETREEMVEIITEYMTSIYPDWDMKKLYYEKGSEYK